MTVGQARRLRQRMTDAERKLWAGLRDRQLAGFKFRRQHPLGRYVVDFLDDTHKLVIEIDGGQHADRAKEDKLRTAWLEREGCRVLRFWNNEVLKNLSGVLQTIRAALPEKPQDPHPRAVARDLSQGRG